MKKDELRKVIYNWNNKTKEGYFHGFSTCGNIEEGIETAVIVEDEEGYLLELFLKDIKFIK